MRLAISCDRGEVILGTPYLTRRVKYNVPRITGAAPSLAARDGRNRYYSAAALPQASDAARSLVAALRCRGFLLEEDQGRHRLAALAPADDRAALAGLLADRGLSPAGEMLAAGGLDTEALQALLTKAGGGPAQLVEGIVNGLAVRQSEGVCRRHEETWSWYSRQDSGSLPAVDCLETGTALLVRAFVAIAAHTGHSCEGHGFGPRNAAIGFSSEYAWVWARFVCRLLGLGDRDWFFSRRSLWIRRKDDNELLSQSVAAAEKILANRPALVAFRRQVLGRLPQAKPSPEAFAVALQARAAELALAAVAFPLPAQGTGRPASLPTMP